MKQCQIFYVHLSINILITLWNLSKLNDRKTGKQTQEQKNFVTLHQISKYLTTVTKQLLITDKYKLHWKKKIKGMVKCKSQCQTL
jgi:hypothetical protein